MRISDWSSDVCSSDLSICSSCSYNSGIPSGRSSPSASSAFRLSVFGFRFGRLGRFDETHQDEDRNGCGANGDGRTFANNIAWLVYQIVDILVGRKSHVEGKNVSVSGNTHGTMSIKRNKCRDKI